MLLPEAQDSTRHELPTPRLILAFHYFDIDFIDIYLITDFVEPIHKALQLWIPLVFLPKTIMENQIKGALASLHLGKNGPGSVLGLRI